MLEVPSVQMRRATERPQVYDCGSSVKFDPGRPEDYPYATVVEKLEALRGKTWEHGLGDGHASERVVADLVERLHTPDGFRMHLPERYHLDISRSFREDGLDACRRPVRHGVHDCRRCRACEHAGFTLVARPRRDAARGRIPADRGRHRHRAAVPAWRSTAASACGSCRSLDPIDPEILFRDYAFSSSTVAPLVKHFEDYADWLDDRFQPKRVVEFGCNDGILLGAARSTRDRGDRRRHLGEHHRHRPPARPRHRDRLLRRGHSRAAFVRGLAAPTSSPAATPSPTTLDPERDRRSGSDPPGGDGHAVPGGDVRRRPARAVQWDTLYHEHLTFYSLGTVADAARPIRVLGGCTPNGSRCTAARSGSSLQTSLRARRSHRDARDRRVRERVEPQ